MQLHEHWLLSCYFVTAYITMWYNMSFYVCVWPTRMKTGPHCKARKDVQMQQEGAPERNILRLPFNALPRIINILPLPHEYFLISLLCEACSHYLLGDQFSSLFVPAGAKWCQGSRPSWGACGSPMQPWKASWTCPAPNCRGWWYTGLEWRKQINKGNMP